jgi:UDPglucose 6-dehydrogenase
MSQQICVVGTGYVGMACCIGLSMLGHRVHGFDIMPERIDRLKRGIAPYQEAGIDASLREQLARQTLEFFDSIEAAARTCPVIIVAVGTPSRDDGSADMSALHHAIAMLSAVELDARPTIVIRSTVPPGTSDAIAETVRGWADVAFAPEFLREGTALVDFLNPDRIVVGSGCDAAADAYVDLFASLEKPVVRTSRCNAELIKACSNAFLALKISFANEVANLCDAVGGFADEVLPGVGFDHRIGKEFLQPGIGFGGPCFEKDVKSMAHISNQYGVDSQLFAATLRVNEAQPRRIIMMLEAALGGLDGAEVGVWGLTFKQGTSDTRDSLAMRIVDELSRRGASTTVYDPAIHVAPLPNRSRLVRDPLVAAESDALLVLTDWPEFSSIDPMEIVSRVRRGIVIDGRNLLDAVALTNAGMIYRGVGRPYHRKSTPSQLSDVV